VVLLLSVVMAILWTMMLAIMVRTVASFPVWRWAVSTTVVVWPSVVVLSITPMLAEMASPGPRAVTVAHPTSMAVASIAIKVLLIPGHAFSP
jgi:hypothetical protein